MWITLKQIACLRAVSEEGSVSAASEKLGKAKSAVHYTLRKLEEQVGFRLLDTNAYRGQLTVKGMQLLESSRDLLHQADLLKERIHRIASGAELKLRLSASALFPIKKLNKSILKVQRRFPETEIVFNREILSGEKMLRSGVVDIAILESLRPLEGLEVKKIGQVQMPLLIAKTHPFLGLSRKQQTKENLFRYPQIIQRSTIESDAQEGVYKTTRQWTVNDMESKKQIIIDGLGWGRLPQHEVSKMINAGRLVILKHIEEPFEIEMFMARKPQSPHGAVSELLWEMDWS